MNNFTSKLGAIICVIVLVVVGIKGFILTIKGVENWPFVAGMTAIVLLAAAVLSYVIFHSEYSDP